jgi:uncharacterized protein (TIGR03118 family)
MTEMRGIGLIVLRTLGYQFNDFLIMIRMMTMKSFILPSLILLTPCLSPAANKYIQHNLVSDQAGMADFQDPNMINPWGICTSATSPFWLSDNGTGLSTLYTSIGTPNATTKPAVPATISTVAGGKPTGCVNNSTTTAFMVSGGGKTGSASFLFVTENGSISGWSSAVNAAQAIVVADNSKSGDVYKGMAIGTPTGGTPRIYVTNFNAGTVEVYDQAWTTLAVALVDPAIPAGFAPFNIQNLGGKLYVTYAKQDAKKMDDVAGAGNGYVSVFDLNGVLLTHLISGGNLNSPWGLAIAPANFGDFANDLLVGNFGDGAINVYNPTTGAFIAQLQNSAGTAILIPGLWALQVGNGGNGGYADAVYFTAGPGSEAHGLLGVLQAAPVAAATASVLNAASYTATIAPGGFIDIAGVNLAPTTRLWGNADFVNGKLPTSLTGVSVTVDGKPAYVYYISPNQIDAIAPADTTQGSVPVVVTNNGLAGASVTATQGTYAPGFFITKNNYIAALHANGTIVGPTTLYPNNSTPTTSGETISLYVTGLGPTVAVEDGLVVTANTNTTTTPTVTVNGVSATVTFSGLTAAGLYQVNITVPAGTANGDQPVVLTIGGAKSQANALINVQN